MSDECITLRSGECERLIRVLRSYTREVEYQHGVPVVEADVLADRLEARRGGGDE